MEQNLIIESNQEQSDKEEPQHHDSEKSLNYLLEILKLEIEIINKSMEHIIDNTQTIKNWTVVTWTGSIALVLGKADLHNYFIITAIPPLMFWYTDAWWRSLQSRYAFRANEIRTFLNGENLPKSFNQGKLVDFVSFDPSGRSHKGSEDYQRFTKVTRTAIFPDLLGFYLPFILISIGMFLYFK